MALTLIVERHDSPRGRRKAARPVPKPGGTPMSPLDPAQIERFKRQGCLLLEGLIDPGTLSAWRDQFWSHVGADHNDPATWPEDYVIRDFAVDPPFGQLPGMRSIIEQLGGGMFGGGGGSMLVKWPGPEGSAWKMPDSGHMDGYGPGGWSGGFMLGATTYMDDVEPGGGGFVYWPRSHGPVQAYFREHPEQIDGSFRDREGLGGAAVGVVLGRVASTGPWSSPGGRATSSSGTASSVTRDHRTCAPARGWASSRAGTAPTARR